MPSIQEIKLVIINEKPMTTSREIALHFEKQHKTVLHKIENLDCSPQFNEHNFMPVTYQDSKGESRKAYQITRNGFMYLAMGFTGKRAGQFKEAYIHAFDTMELERQKLRQIVSQQAKPTLNDFLNAAEPLEKTLVEVIHTKQGEIVQIDKLKQKSAPKLSKKKSTPTNKPLWITLVETFFTEIDRGGIPEKMCQNMLIAKETITSPTGERKTHPCLFFRASNMMEFFRENPHFVDLMTTSSITTTQTLLTELNKAGVLALGGKTKEKGIPINPSMPLETRRVPHLVAIDLVILKQEYGIVLLNSENIARAFR